MEEANVEVRVLLSERLLLHMIVIELLKANDLSKKFVLAKVGVLEVLFLDFRAHDRSVLRHFDLW